jgi:hypothetical protein
MARAAYECLKHLPPFNRWRLPPSEEIRFRVTNSAREYGSYDSPGGKHSISISRRLVTTGQGLLCVMAHETLHLHQRIARTENCSQHNKHFRRLALTVCKQMGYETRGFV